MFILQLQSDLEEARLEFYPFKTFAHCFLNTSHIRLLLATSPSLNAFFQKIFVFEHALLNSSLSTNYILLTGNSIQNLIEPIICQPNIQNIPHII